jgi:CRP-like cAMP-binding protein
MSIQSNNNQGAPFILSECKIMRSYEASQRRILSNISSSAEEKYQNFIKTYPDIIYRIPLRMIASYLGVSRETLSRVRNQFVHK